MTCPAGGCWLCQPAAARRTYAPFHPVTRLFPRMQSLFSTRLPPAPSWLLYVNSQPLFPPYTVLQKFHLDKPRIFGIIVHVVCQQNRICSGIEEVITSTTGNRVVVKSGTRVRIPPTAPDPASHKACGAFHVMWRICSRGEASNTRSNKSTSKGNPSRQQPPLAYRS